MAIDREAIRDCKLAYMAMFDQIAHPDGSNYSRLRGYVWSIIERHFSDEDNQRQTQALSALTYTLMLTALTCAAAEALDASAEHGHLEQQRVNKAAWCLGLSYAIGLSHPDTVEGEHGWSVLGADSLKALFAEPVPDASDAHFWGEFAVLGEALYQRMFTVTVLTADDPSPLLYAVGVGFGLCPRGEVVLRTRLVRALVAKVFGIRSDAFGA